MDRDVDNYLAVNHSFTIWKEMLTGCHGNAIQLKSVQM